MSRRRLKKSARPRHPALERALLAAWSATQEGDLAEAGRILHPLTERYRSHPDVLLVGAYYAFALGKQSPELQIDGEVHRPLEDAEAIIAEALDRAPTPQWPAAHWAKAVILYRLGRYEEAAEAAAVAVRFGGDKLGAWLDYGSILGGLGRFDEAMVAYDRAARQPGGDLGAALFSRAHLHLLRGDYARGWAGYEARLESRAFMRDVGRPFMKDYPARAWDGNPIPGRRLLVYVEQGFGDSFLLWRYLPWAAEQSQATIILETHAPLIRLARDDRGLGASIVVRSGDPLPRWDRHVSIYSLPALHRTTVETVPDTTNSRRRHLECRGADLRIGFAHAGSSSFVRNRERSTQLNTWRRLWECGHEWHSVTTGREAEDLKDLPENVHDRSREIRDFRDTLAILRTCDLVISVDTAVANLAGRYGLQTWVLLPYVPDWRWGLDDDSTPWYPTATLFRQPALHDWESVFCRLAYRLRAHEVAV